MPDFVRRSYQEIVRDALTRLVGGVAGEPLVFRTQDNQDGFLLEKHPVAELLRAAVRLGDEVREIPRDQVELVANQTRVRFLDEGGLREGAPVYVDYRPVGASSPITDVHVGSVARTLTESLGRELAFFFVKLERVYRDAFVDSAEAESLDRVVALLGVQRIRAGAPTVTLTFSRATPAPGDVPIPVGTLVSTGVRSDGSEIRFETASAQILKQGTREVDALARALPDSVERADEAEIGALRVLPRPIIGIDRVTNYSEVFHSSDDESDEALRVRAKTALQGAGKVTLDALRSAVLDQGALSVILRDMPRGAPGEVEVFVDLPDYDSEEAEHAHQNRVLHAIDGTRGAGVRVFTNFARKVYVAIGRLRVVLREGLNPTEDERTGMKAGVKRSLEAYVAKLTMGEAITYSGLVAAALTDERLRNVIFDEVETYQEDRLTRTPGGTAEPRRMHDTEVRLLHASGAPVAQIGADASFDRVYMSRDERAVLLLPEDIEIVTQTRRVVHAVVVDVEFRVVPVDNLVDRDSLRDRVTRQRIEPTIRAYFDDLAEGQSVSLNDILELLDSRHYSLENALLDAHYVRDQRVLIGVTSVPVTGDERAELGELRVK
ncbi:baseplate J/gp47 family protein [Haliangium sp.]|uniref:baseplate J/gp47 family protein n=1 Tax=Haliangium sp. TaxID=2663208 RepID=UPI003D0FCDBC